MQEKYIQKHNENEGGIDDGFSSTEEFALKAVFAVSGSHLRFFDNATLFSLSHTSQCLRGDVSFEIKTRAKELVQHVVLGEEEQAEALIKECPELLLYQAEVVDYSDRIIIGTALQAAAGAEDIRMCKMILKYMDNEEALAQFNEQFPNGLEAEYNFNAETVYDFTPIINAMINNSDELEELIAEFRVSMTANNGIKSGLHFNIQHLIAAYNAYVNNWTDLKNSAPDYKNCHKFWVEIIGFIQRQMPANYAQAYCSGLNLLEVNPKYFKRTLSLYNPNNLEGGDAAFPLLGASGGELGVDFAIYSYSGRVLAIPQSSRFVVGPSGAPPAAFRKLCGTKSNGLAELRDYLEQEPGRQPEV